MKNLKKAIYFSLELYGKKAKEWRTFIVAKVLFEKKFYRVYAGWKSHRVPTFGFTEYDKKSNQIYWYVHNGFYEERRFTEFS